jgi:hypothetical protein
LVQELAWSSVSRNKCGRMIEHVQDLETFLPLNPFFWRKLPQFKKPSFVTSKVKSKDELQTRNGYSKRHHLGKEILVIQTCFEQPLQKTNRFLSVLQFYM